MDLDVTCLYKTVKEKGYKFFPTYLWLVTRNLCKQQEFKIAIKDDKLGYFDTLTPLYATWHEDTKTFSFLWTEYKEDFEAFYNDYLKNQMDFGNNHGILGQPGVPPENAYTVSALPWVDFKHFAVHSFENKAYFLPSIEAGKYQREGNQIIMPLSITCHHATTDGWHIARFLEDLKGDIEDLPLV